MRLTRFAARLCILAAAAAPATAEPAPGWGLPQLMQGMAQVRAATGRFTERKTLHLLNAPLIDSGTLTYRAPAFLEKSTTTPVPEIFVLDHGVATLSGGPDGQTHRFALADAPEIGSLIEGIRATLAGDLPALQHYYRLQLTGSAAQWQLTLQPRDAAAAHFIKYLIIQGQQNRITAIDTVSGNGDHSEMGIAESITDAR